MNSHQTRPVLFGLVHFLGTRVSHEAVQAVQMEHDAPHLDIFSEQQ